jgi:hypothetical protein
MSKMNTQEIEHSEQPNVIFRCLHCDKTHAARLSFESSTIVVRVNIPENWVYGVYLGKVAAFCSRNCCRTAGHTLTSNPFASFGCSVTSRCQLPSKHQGQCRTVPLGL